MTQHSTYRFATVLAFVLAAKSASAQTFTAGDLVVSTYGSPTSTTLQDGAITPITLDEFSLSSATSGSLVLADQLPSLGTNAAPGIVGEYGSSSEGTLNLSGNGQYLVIGGYDGTASALGIQAASNSANGTNYAPGTPWSTSTIALGQSASADVPRVFATIDASGAVNTSTVLNDVYNTNNPRSGYSPDGSSLYISGQGAGVGDEGGIYLTQVGVNTTSGGSAPTPIYNVVSTRDVTEYNGNFYYSADQNSKSKGTQTGIFEYTGAPTTTQGATTGTVIVPANNGGTTKSTTINYSPDDFAFANSSTLYVADTGDPKAGGTGDGGIQKWSYLGGTWKLDYTLVDPNFVAPNKATTAASGETGFEALTLKLAGSSVDIYAVSYTAGDANPNGLYAIVDNLSATTLPTGSGTESFTELAAAPGLTGTNSLAGDEIFKGVAFAPQAVPEPSSYAFMMLGLAALIWRSRIFRRA
jgi:hypothetical protein